ncbi:unnamed protein product, partial [Candidula unifasciata]
MSELTNNDTLAKYLSARILKITTNINFCLQRRQIHYDYCFPIFTKFSICFNCHFFQFLTFSINIISICACISHVN